MAYPTFREWLGLEGLTSRQLKKQLKREEWRFEHLISDSGDWDMTEIEAWLDSDLEPEDMGLLEGMSYTPYGPPIEFYEQISQEDSESIGLTLVEGDHPGSSFAGVQLFNTPRDANRELQRLGINVVVGGLILMAGITKFTLCDTPEKLRLAEPEGEVQYRY